MSMWDTQTNNVKLVEILAFKKKDRKGRGQKNQEINRNISRLG